MAAQRTTPRYPRKLAIGAAPTLGVLLACYQHSAVDDAVSLMHGATAAPLTGSAAPTAHSVAMGPVSATSAGVALGGAIDTFVLLRDTTAAQLVANALPAPMPSNPHARLPSPNLPQRWVVADSGQPVHCGQLNDRCCRGR